MVHYSISDNFPICFSRKINSKIKKRSHTSKSYRCFKIFSEELFLADLAREFNSFSLSQSSIDYDINSWYKHFLKQLDRHIPIKTKRVKPKHLPS